MSKTMVIEQGMAPIRKWADFLMENDIDKHNQINKALWYVERIEERGVRLATEPKCGWHEYQYASNDAYEIHMISCERHWNYGERTKLLNMVSYAGEFVSAILKKANRSCSECSGSGRIRRYCRTCTGLASQKCESCKGKGHAWYECDGCGGDGFNKGRKQ